MRHRLLLASSFLFLIVTNIIWIVRDTRLPFWDMAYHQTGAVHIVAAFAKDGLAAFAAIPGLTGVYPPVYHSIVALFFGVFGTSSDVARFANIPATAILFFGTYAFGRTLLSPLAASIAAVLVSFYPIMLWLSRETMIDYWLASIVVLAMWLLTRTKDFSRTPESIAFGVVCGLGLLTKLTFAMFLGLPALWVARKNPKNAAIAAAVALAVAAYWYVPEWQTLKTFYEFNSSSGVTEGDPARVSWQALVFYVRAMEGYQLFLPLFVLFVVATINLTRHYNPAWIPVLLWIAGAGAGLMLMQNKDPKYSMPLLPAVALVTAKLFERKPAWLAALLPFLLFQHYLVSFGIPRLPEKVVLAKGIEGPHSWDWNLYSQSYFEIWGKPDRADWRIDYVLDKVTPAAATTVRLGMIPDIPRFDALAFEFQILLRKAPVVVSRLWTFDEAAIWNTDYILLSETDQGFAKYFAHDLDRTSKFVLDHPENFSSLESFPLPSGEVIRLFKVVGK